MGVGEDGGSCCFGGGHGAGAWGFWEGREGEDGLGGEKEVDVLLEAVHGVVGDDARGGRIRVTLRKKEG